MKYYNTFKSSNGSYRTVEWSQAEMGDFNIIMLIFYCVLLGVLSIIISPLFIFVTLHDFEDKGVKPSIYGAIISIVYLLDIHYKFLLYLILKFFILGDYWLHVSVNLNIAYLVVHLFLVFFSATVYYNVVDKTKRMATLALATLIVFLLSFGIASAVRSYTENSVTVETQK